MIMFLYCFISLSTAVSPASSRSYVHHQFTGIFHSGKLGLTLQFPEPARCEQIKVPICKNGLVGYAETLLPNIFEDRNQHQASLSLESFSLLLYIDCSLYLRTFLCSLYLPMCSLPLRNEPILPCHHLCVKVRKDCGHFVDKFGFPWPDELNCENFPKSGLCFSPPILDHSQANSTIDTILDYFPKTSLTPSNKKEEDTDGQFSVVPSNFLFGINGLRSIRCGRLCSDVLYINLWIEVYSILCLLSTFCAICIFISDRKRYLYPERSLVWMSGCYMVLSIVYIIEYFTQEQMVPTLSETTNNTINNNNSLKSPETEWSFSNTGTQFPTSNISTTRNDFEFDVQNKEDHSCIFYFVIQNISMAAGYLWWSMASVSAYLFVSHRSGFVEMISPLFHITVWTLSSLFSVMMIVGFAYPLQDGFCSLSTFLNSLLLLCCLFFFLLFKIKKLTLEQRILTRNWDGKMKLFSEICIFTFLTVVVCQLIELDEKGKLKSCVEVDVTHETCFQNQNRLRNVIKVKNFMMFFPGIASGLCMFLAQEKKTWCYCPSGDNGEIPL